MNWEFVDWTIIGPAVMAGMLVLSTHVPLGQVVLKRGIIFIDLAIAQIAALGVIAAGFFGWQERLYIVQVAAVSAALLAAAFLNWTEKHWPRSQEALIGTLFVLAATGAILLLAENPHGGDYLKDLLVGQNPVDHLDQSDSDRHSLRHPADGLVHQPGKDWSRGFLRDFCLCHNGGGAACGCLSRVRQPDPSSPGNTPLEWSAQAGRGLWHWCLVLPAGNRVVRLG